MCRIDVKKYLPCFSSSFSLTFLRLIDWLICWFCLITWSIDWLIAMVYLSICFVDCFFDWLIDQLIDWSQWFLYSFTWLTAFFKGASGPSAIPVKPKSRPTGNAHFRGDTTHVTDFKPWAGTRRKPIIQDKPYQPPQHPFDAKSEAQSQYLGERGEPTMSKKPAAKLPATGKFYSRTSYVAEFPQHSVECRVDTLHDNYDHTHTHEGHHFFRPK